MTVRVWKQNGFDLAGTWNCYMLLFQYRPVVRRVPVSLPKLTLHPGDKIVEMGREHASAGSVYIKMLPGHTLDYIGLFKDFALFKSGDAPIVPKYGAAYFAFQILSNNQWFFTTPAVAGRIIETTFVRLLKPTTHMKCPRPLCSQYPNLHVLHGVLTEQQWSDLFCNRLAKRTAAQMLCKDQRRKPTQGELNRLADTIADEMHRFRPLAERRRQPGSGLLI